MKSQFSRSPFLLMIGMAASSVSAQALTYSFEGTAHQWSSVEEISKLEVVKAGEGVPPEAVTDGEDALKISHAKTGGGFVPLMRINHQDRNWWNALKHPQNTRVRVDVFVPAEATKGIATNWAVIGLALQGGGYQAIRTQQDLKPGRDNKMAIELDLTPVKEALKTAPWSQLTLFINTGDGTATRSPVYVDNFRILPAESDSNP
ncbi:MAG: hypothetical protein WD708_04745 [Kiritimatiellia bacterium]